MIVNIHYITYIDGKRYLSPRTNNYTQIDLFETSEEKAIPKFKSLLVVEPISRYKVITQKMTTKHCNLMNKSPYQTHKAYPKFDFFNNHMPQLISSHQG